MIKHIRLVALAGTVVLGIVVCFALLSIFRLREPGTTANKSTDTLSAEFDSDTEKIAFLDQYLVLHSAVEAAEFHIVYHDNSTGFVPGPSDWNIQAVLKVAPADVSRWTDGRQLVATDSVDLAWGYALLPDEARWQVQSQPMIYTSLGAIIVVFAPEGILFTHHQTT